MTAPPTTFSQRMWTSLGWAPQRPPPAVPCIAAKDPVLRNHFEEFLMMDKKFCPSEIAGLLSNQELWNLGYDRWEEVMPALLELTWEMRAYGVCEILRKDKKTGKFTRVLSDDVGIEDYHGPIRIRRVMDEDEDHKPIFTKPNVLRNNERALEGW